MKDGIKMLSYWREGAFTTLDTTSLTHGSSTMQSSLLQALGLGKGKGLPERSRSHPHFPPFLLSNQPGSFLFLKISICHGWWKCLISNLCLGTLVPSLLFRLRWEPKWKLPPAVVPLFAYNYCSWWICQKTPTGQIDQIISQFPLQLLQFMALHRDEIGEGKSDFPLEINTLKKIVCLAERLVCLSAAVCTIKTPFGYKSLLFIILASTLFAFTSLIPGEIEWWNYGNIESILQKI